MRKIGFRIAGIFLTAAMWIPSAMAAEGQEVLERISGGVVNWTQGVVTAKGSGAPPPGVKVISQARLMAERAARAEALRNLLETVKGVRVDADTTIENFITQKDVLMIRVSGIVRGATQIDKRYLSDGSVEVTMEIRLTGELLEVMLKELPPLTTPLMPMPLIPLPEKPSPPPKALPPPPPPPPPEKKVSPPPPVEEKKVPPPPLVTEKKAPPSLPIEEKKLPPAPEVQAKVEKKLDLKKVEYSGLIVDARRLGLRPALVPKILNEKGELVYSARSLEQQDLIKMGLVGYAKDVDAAAKNQRVTADPYVIAGLNASGEKKTDVVISNQEAQIVMTTAPYTGYLKNGRVMIVYD
jgi:hypothetical protein